MKKHNIAGSGLMKPGQFFGTSRVQTRSDDFVVSTVSHTQARAVPRHAHAHASFSMVVSGSYREWFAGREWDARPLSMVMRPAEVEHRDEIGGGGALFLWVDIVPNYWQSLSDAGIRFERRAFEERPMSCVALRLLRELHERGADWENVAEALISELIDEYTAESRRTHARRPAWLRRALDLMGDGRAHHSLGTLSRELDLHPVHVTREFKRQLGLTPAQHLRQLRLQRVARALLGGDDSLSDLADAHGYADQSHLTREFKRGTGWSPAQLRCACHRLR